MKKPNVIVRRGDRFILNEYKLFPHLRKEEDMVRTALTMACLHYETHPEQYTDLSQQDKLNKVNEVFYQLLTDWGIYKGRR